MKTVIMVFISSIAYAVVGNAVVYMILVRRKIPLSFFWAGMPGYLYRICLSASPRVGASLRRFALSVNIALLVAVLLGIGLIANGA